MAALARRFAAEPIDRAVASRGDNPTRRARRQSGSGPSLHGNGERILNRLLGDVDVAEVAHQDRDGAAVLFAKHTFDLRSGEGRHDRD